jgi:hypothetical protein
MGWAGRGQRARSKFLPSPISYPIHKLLRTASDAQGRLAIWCHHLLEFDFEFQYSPGKEHHAADTMSRLRPPNSTFDMEPVDTDMPCFEVCSEAVTAGNRLASQAPGYEDPSPFLVHDLREIQHHCYPDGARSDDPSLDVDEFGIVGTVRSSGEFLPLLPESLLASALYEEVESYPEDYLRREDAPVLRRGTYKVLPGVEGKISLRLRPLTDFLFPELSNWRNS